MIFTVKVNHLKCLISLKLLIMDEDQNRQAEYNKFSGLVWRCSITAKDETQTWLSQGKFQCCKTAKNIYSKDGF